MEKIFLSRQYLEAMSTTDLISFADNYGIDIPDNLNRRFIIAELLEAADEFENIRKADSKVIISEDSVEIPDELPKTYNETQINAILRNPGWCFVFWDIKESEIHKIHLENATVNLFLRVNFFDTFEMENKVDSFDIQVSEADRERYVLIPAGKDFFNIELVCVTSSSPSSILSSTKCIAVPKGCDALSKLQPGKDIKSNQLIKLSGMEKLLREHFNNFRQSF